MADILGRRALSAGRLAGLGATLDFHHGLLALDMVIHQVVAVGPIHGYALAHRIWLIHRP
jgi:hypothetical protein